MEIPFRLHKRLVLKQLEPDGEGDDLQAQTSTTLTRQWYANVFATPLE